jgi:hypothetical protein
MARKVVRRSQRKQKRQSQRRTQRRTQRRSQRRTQRKQKRRTQRRTQRKQKRIMNRRSKRRSSNQFGGMRRCLGCGMSPTERATKSKPPAPLQTVDELRAAEFLEDPAMSALAARLARAGTLNEQPVDPLISSGQVMINDTDKELERLNQANTSEEEKLGVAIKEGHDYNARMASAMSGVAGTRRPRATRTPEQDARMRRRQAFAAREKHRKTMKSLENIQRSVQRTTDNAVRLAASRSAGSSRKSS